ncbi:MAG: hypothetical protein JRF65_12625 [Deltaproteobacteria bacterium]|nr:hypothetical protein [Deltaproteobacteria bacterium]
MKSDTVFQKFHGRLDRSPPRPEAALATRNPVIGTVKFYIMMSAAMDKAKTFPPDVGAFVESLKTEDPTALWVLGSAFLALWLYAVMDAAVWGARLEASEKGNPA